MRLWWNWQTRYFEVVVGQPVQVQVLLSAPLLSGTRRHRYLKPNIKFRAPVYFPRIAMGISSETAADQATPQTALARVETQTTAPKTQRELSPSQGKKAIAVQGSAFRTNAVGQDLVKRKKALEKINNGRLEEQTDKRRGGEQATAESE